MTLHAKTYTNDFPFSNGIPFASCLKSIKFTEVKNKRLLKATPMERKKLMFADNSYIVYMSVVFD